MFLKLLVIGINLLLIKVRFVVVLSSVKIFVKLIVIGVLLIGALISSIAFLIVPFSP